MKREIKLLEKLMETSWSKKQYALIESLRNSSARSKRGLSPKQRELANKIYLQLRMKTLFHEANKLLNELEFWSESHIQSFIDTYVYTSPLPKKDVQWIIHHAIDNCRNAKKRERILNYYIDVFK